MNPVFISFISATNRNGYRNIFFLGSFSGKDLNLHTCPTRSTSCFFARFAAFVALRQFGRAKFDEMLHGAWDEASNSTSKKAPSPSCLLPAYPESSNLLTFAVLCFSLVVGGHMFLLILSIFGVFGIIKCLLFLLSIRHHQLYMSEWSQSKLHFFWTFSRHSMYSIYVPIFD